MLYTMDEVFETYRINYTEFHKDLTRFCDHVPSMFLADTPTELFDVKLLPAHMSPKDPDFSSDYAENVIKKWSFILNVTDRILDKIHLFLGNNNKNWFDSQKVKLQWWIALVKISANALKTLNETGKTVQYRSLSSGIGGVNKITGSNERGLELRKNEIKLESLMKALDSKK